MARAPRWASSRTTASPMPLAAPLAAAADQLADGLGPPLLDLLGLLRPGRRAARHDRDARHGRHARPEAEPLPDHLLLHLDGGPGDLARALQHWDKHPSPSYVRVY